MKFHIDTNGFTKPFVIDGFTAITITLEVGDVFIDSDNKVKGIKNIFQNKIELIDEESNHSFEALPLNKEFLTKYKYAGTTDDDELPIYEDAISLCDVKK